MHSDRTEQKAGKEPSAIPGDKQAVEITAMFSISKRGFNGACILSAVGSLPMHVMPVLVASAILAGQVSAAQAGLFASMYAFGQLFVTLLLPLLAVRFLRSVWATRVCVLLVLLICLAAQLSGEWFYLNWFLIGVCCGILSYLGSTSAAAVENKSVAYTMRLGVTLLVAGFTMLVFYAIDKFAGFAQLTFSLGMVVTLLCLAGLYLYTSPVLQPGSVEKPVSSNNPGGDIRWGLVYLFVFSFAQVGFIVFAVESAMQRGIDISDALWAFAFCKIMAAGLLLRLKSRKPQDSVSNQLSMVSIPVLMVGCFLVASSQDLLLFFVGILLWETSVNVMSSSFQGSVVEVNPPVGGMYLTSVLLLGSATGPAVNGIAISHSWQDYFNCLVLVSVFLPLLWEFHRACSGSRNTRESKRVRNFLANLVD